MRYRYHEKNGGVVVGCDLGNCVLKLNPSQNFSVMFNKSLRLVSVSGG